MTRFRAQISAKARATTSLLATHCFHPGSEETYHVLNQSPALANVRFPQCWIRFFLRLVKVRGGWESKFSIIIANPASSTEGSLGFRRYHLSRPKLDHCCHFPQGMVQSFVKDESSGKVSEFPSQSHNEGGQL